MEHQETIKCDACGELHNPSQISAGYWMNQVICHNCIEEMEGFFDDEDEDLAREQASLDWYESISW
jgi:hypothetical protein